MVSETHIVYVLEKLEKFWISKQYTDLKIKTTDGESAVHQILLNSLCSQKVKANSGLVKPTAHKLSDIITVKCSHNDLECFLRLVYCPSSLKQVEFNNKKFKDIARQLGIDLFLKKNGSDDALDFTEFCKKRNVALSQTLLSIKRSVDLSDIKLIVNHQKFFCHKVILSSFSAFFDAMFSSDLKEYQQEEIEIHNVDKHIFMSILDFMYTGENIVNTNNVQDILSTSSYLQIPQLQGHSERFMCRHIEIENCIDVAKLGDAINSEYLLTRAVNFICHNFRDLLKKDNFKTITKNLLIRMLQEDHINTSNEYELLQSSISWLKHNKETKPLEIVEHIHLHQILDEELEEAMKEPIIKSDKQCREYITVAMKSKISPSKQRRSFESEEVMLVMWSSSYNHGVHLACYSFKSSSWYQMPGMPDHTTGGSYASCSDLHNVFISGGYANKTAFYRFSLAQVKWENLGPVEHKYGRADHAMVIQDNEIFLIGGSQDRMISLPHVDKYNVKDRSWTRIGELAIAVSNPSSVLFGNNILVFGGNKSFGEFVKSIQKFDTTTGSCTVFSKLPVMCSFSGLTVNEDEVYIVGPKGDVMLYEYGKEPTVIGSVHKQSMFGFGMIYRQGKVFVIGGNSDKTESLETRAFDVHTRKQCLALKNMKIPARKASNQYFATVVNIRSSLLTPENVCDPH